MKILIHARLRDVFDNIRTTLEAQRHQVDGAFTIAEGILRMSAGTYDKIFISIGVALEERLQLMALARRLGTSMIEIIDGNTVVREMLMHTSSGKHVCLPQERSASM